MIHKLNQSYVNFITFVKRKKSSNCNFPFENFESQECYFPSLVEIDFKILKKVFKLRTCNFTNLRVYLPFERDVALYF